MMTRRLLLAALALSFGAFVAQAGDQDFTLVNKTGVEINSLYVSPSDQNEWGADILGEDTLDDGESAEITFSPKTKAEFWDVKVEDKDGNSIVWKKLNLLEISKLTLFFDHDKGKATAKAE